jgi:arylsulfatase A-like enzyme
MRSLVPRISIIFFVATVATFFTVACIDAEEDTVEQPNIIFVLIDDLGKEWVSCYGAEEVETPNVDALAAEGMRFENAYSCPQCTPSRVALMTGQYPYRNGWVNHWDVPRWGAGCHFDPTQYPCVIGRSMKEAGYATGIAGKWQIDDFRVEPEAMRQTGFDDWCMWTGYETGIPASGARYWDPYVNTPDEGSRTIEGAFGPDVYNDFVLDFIEEHREEPFFIYYPMALTHGPLVHTPHEMDVTDKMDKHKAMVRYTDFLLGKIIDQLEDQGIRERTIVIWTTDNGTAGGIAGQMQDDRVSEGSRRVPGGKAKTTENGVNAPFVANCPGLVPEGVVTTALIDFTDILPTCVDLAGGEVPTLEQVSGLSFADVLLGQAEDSQREWILGMGCKNEAQVSDEGVQNRWYFRDRVLRDERYKLFIGIDRSGEKFIDLWNDPLEENDLTGQETPEQLAARERLEAVVAEMPERDSDPRYLPNPPQPWDRKVTVESLIWKSGRPDEE